jgi:ribosomal protein L17
MSDPKSRDDLARMRAIERAMAEDILAMTDEEILAEAKSEGVDTAAKAQELRASALAVVNTAKRRRLEDARARLEGEAKGFKPPAKRPLIDEIKRRFQAILKGGGANGLAIAFRNGQQQSDDDWETLWDDLVELGLAKPDEHDR